MNPCPCCSGELLRHVRPEGMYWFCLRCRQEMPDLTLADLKELEHSIPNDISLPTDNT